MAYQAQITRTNPGCILFMVDQSSSMSDRFGSAQSSESKAEFVATALNRFLRDLVLRCTKEEPEPRNYFHVGVIGYGETVGPALDGALAGRELHPIGEVAKNPLELADRLVKESDGAGGIIEVSRRFPVWLRPTARNGTPMADAFERIHDIVAEWLGDHRDCFPPIVINLTDGEANPDSDPALHAQRITQLTSSDGAALVFNCHISSRQESSIQFPASDNLPDQFARQLYGMSSPLPPPMLTAASRVLQREVPEGARGFTFQADGVAVTEFITIGTQISQELR